MRALIVGPLAAVSALTSGWRVDAAGGQVDRMPAARLEDELEHRLGVQVVELDRVADTPAHQDPGSARLPGPLELVRVALRMHHAGDVLDALAVLSEPLLVD